MNPIYKFNLSVNGTSQQAYPLYDNGLAKDYALQSGEQFFRASLSGNLTFVGPDFDRINGAVFDAQFGVEILISYDAGQTWATYWTGEFWKTDCDFDLDAKTVAVKPAVIDQYTAVLAGLDKEYNLIDLAPEIVPVKADKRPMIQVYIPGQTVIGCFLSGMWWEQDCESVLSEQDLINHYYFALLKTQYYTFAIRSEQSPSGNYWRAELVRLADGATWDYETVVDAPEPTLPLTLSADATTGATGTVLMDSRTINIYGRYILDVDEILGLSTYPIPDDDLVPDNRNYSRAIGYAVSNTIFFSSQLTSTPTPWGIYQPGQYYAPPVNSNVEMFPVARNSWGIVSVWFAFSSLDWIAEEAGRAQFTLKDAFPLSSVISVLLQKIAPGITHGATTTYSRFLYGTNPISGLNQRLLITPKSNLVTAGYDQPAQKAPITLKNVTDMLRDCFRCYWFIDEQNRFRVEHIQYFRNGGSYSGSPVVGIDLTTQKVPRNGKEWAFARNQYKFDKPEMAARYQFGWMDDVTQLFEGFPIDIISKYVNPDNIEQIDVSRFTSDIDYILLNPGAISKDGFVLLAATKNVDVSGFSSSGYFIRTGVNVGETVNLTPQTSSNWRYAILDCMPGESFIVRGASTSGAKLWAFLNENNILISGANPVTYPETTIVAPSGAKKVVFNLYGSTSYARYNLALPYYNYVIDSQDHYLQNAYVAFCILQQYYAFDMPAPLYSINGEQMMAIGIKKLKNQTIRFPLLNDPDLVELVKTNLGNGTIEKLSVNLSSRNANATLKYDTE